MDVVASGVEVGGLVEVLGGSVMNTAQPPVANTSMPAARARNEVAAIVVPALRPVTAARASLPDAGLHDAVLVPKFVDLLGAQPDRRDAAMHSRSWQGRRPPRGPGLALGGDLHVARPGQAVGEDGGFQGHDRASGRDGVGHFGRDTDIRVR